MSQPAETPPSPTCTTPPSDTPSGHHAATSLVTRARRFTELRGRDRELQQREQKQLSLRTSVGSHRGRNATLLQARIHGRIGNSRCTGGGASS